MHSDKNTPSHYRELNTPRHYREEAQRSRKLAEQTRDGLLKTQFLYIAEEYERLANSAERDRRIDQP